MIKYALLILGACYGLLQAATVGGVVTDSAAGTTLGSVIVQLRSGAQILAIDTTDAEGKFSFANVDTGRYTLRATHDDYVTKSVSVTVSKSTPVTKTIPLKAIVTGSVAGTVKDSATGAALAGAFVDVLSGTNVVKAGKSGADGKFSFEKVEVGDYTVQASLAGYVTKLLTAKVTSSASVTVDIPLAAVVTAAVGGSVTDTTTAAAIAGAVVQLRSGSSQIIAVDTSGADGAFSFDKVEVGKYSIRVSFAGYKTKSIAASVTSSAAVIVNVSLAAAAYGAVVGLVTADSINGKALDQVTVILNRNGTPVDTATSDVQGVFSFDKVETGLDYTLYGSKTGYAATTAGLSNKKVNTDSIRFFMAPLVVKKISVFVLTADDSSAIAQASVTFATSGGSAIIANATDATGEAQFEKMEEGAYMITASAAGFTVESKRYGVNAASADSVLIYLSKAARGTKIVCGIVIDSVSAKPLANVLVSVRSTSEAVPITIAAFTSADGAYTIAGIPQTTAAVTLTATLSDYRTTARNVALGDSTKDTTKFDFKMISSAIAVSERKTAPLSGGQPQVTISSNGVLSLSNFIGTGVVRLFDLNGKLFYKFPFSCAGRSTFTLKQRIWLPKTVFIVRVSRPDGRDIISRVRRGQ